MGAFVGLMFVATVLLRCSPDNSSLRDIAIELRRIREELQKLSGSSKL